jgi:predicted nucleotidyltransferase
MRINPDDTVGGHPALLVRKLLRQLRHRMRWDVAELEEAAALSAGTGGSLLKALRKQGLIESAERGLWTVSQAGCTFSVATAAKPITRATAERALAEFLDRVRRVNEDPHFLSKVTKVVLFGSFLRPDVERVGDVDIAVELISKEADFDRARELNLERAEELEYAGHNFRHFLQRECCGYLEVLKYLKGRSRVISLADYTVEKAFVTTVPHRVLMGAPEETAAAPASGAPQSPVGRRRPRGFPF